MTDAYFDHPGFSQSDLKMALDSPRMLWEMKLKNGRVQRPATPAMREGTIIHSAVLEPGAFNDTYAVCGPRNTKAGKEQALQALEQGLDPITEAQATKARDIARQVHKHPLAAELFDEGIAEVPHYERDEATGLQVKGKFDWLCDSGRTVVDLKTVGVGLAAPEAFAKQVANFKYHLQAAHYLGLAQGCLPPVYLDLPQSARFVFVVVEREFPYQIGVYELDEDALIEGRQLRRKALDIVKQCQSFNNWPGHTDDQIQTISLPSWGYAA